MDGSCPAEIEFMGVRISCDRKRGHDGRHLRAADHFAVGWTDLVALALYPEQMEDALHREALRELLSWFPQRPERGILGKLKMGENGVYRSQFIPAEVIEGLREIAHRESE